MSISKADIVKWGKELAKNDEENGRDSKSNPNNAKNGK